METLTPTQYLKIIGNGGSVFVRMLHAPTGKTEGRLFHSDKLTDQDDSEFRRLSELGWHMWAMVSEAVGRDLPKQCHVIWADQDWKNYPGGREQALALRDALPQQPSLIVESGHGQHSYWFLDAPVKPSHAQEVAKNIAWQLGADPLHSPVTKMRIPGTLNPKHMDPKYIEQGITEPTECRVIGGNGQTYSLSELELDPSLVKLGHKCAKMVVNGPDSPATEDRSAFDYKLVAQMIQASLSDSEILRLLTTYHCSGKVKSEGSNGLRYAERTVSEARKRVSFANFGPRVEESSRPAVQWTRKTLKQLKEGEKPEFVVGEFLPKGGTAMIAAPPKARKSWSAMDLAYSVAKGEQWLGFEVPTARKVLYVQAELLDGVVAERMVQMFGDDDLPNLEFINVPSADLLSDSDLEGLLEQVEEFGAELVIIDPIANFWLSDENRSENVNKLFDRLARFKTLGCAVVLVHHARKTATGETITANHMRGSNVWFARVDGVFTISPDQNNVSWGNFVMRNGPARENVRMAVTPCGRFSLEGQAVAVELTAYQREQVKAAMERRKAREAEKAAQSATVPAKEETPPWEIDPKAPGYRFEDEWAAPRSVDLSPVPVPDFDPTRRGTPLAQRTQGIDPGASVSAVSRAVHNLRIAVAKAGDQE